MLNTTILRHMLGAAVWLLLLGGAAAQVDPPGRVARINQFDGAVSFAPAGTDDWSYAQLNRPLTAGDRLWVDPGGRMELHVGSAALRANEQTSLGFVELDDDTVTLKVTQGTVSLRVRNLPRDQHYEIQTPNLAFVPNAPGEYRIDVAPDGSTTNVAIREGSGMVYGEDGAGMPIPGRQQIRFVGRRLAAAGSSPSLPNDAFDGWVRSRDRAEDSSISARYVPREVIGYQQLDNHGTWQETAEYGPVWTPRAVVAGWAPYRTGHWAWIRPWGWTWIDDAPWGFAPYHYGRWAYLGNRWCWVPGRQVHAVAPVYAPALVAFVGGRGASLTLSFGSTRSSGVAWFPLAPGEAYRPAYAVSPRYINNVNRTTVVNNTTINNVVINNTTVNKTVYVNQQAPNAITAVPSATFIRGQAVAPVARPLPRQQLAQAQILSGAPGVAPVKQSVLGDAKPARRPMATSFTRLAPVAMPPAARKELHAEMAPVGRDAPGRPTAERPVAIAPTAAAPAVAVQSVAVQSGTVRSAAVQPAGTPVAAAGPAAPQDRNGVAAAVARKDMPPGMAPAPNRPESARPPMADEKRVFEGVRKLDRQVSAPPSTAPRVMRNEPARPGGPPAGSAEVVQVSSARTEVAPARRDGDRRPQPEIAKPGMAVQAPYPQATPPVPGQAPHAPATPPVARNDSPRPPALRPNNPANRDHESEAISFSGKGREDRRHPPESKAPSPAAGAIPPPKRPSLPEMIVKKPEVQVTRVPPGAADAAHGRNGGEGRPGRPDAGAAHGKDKPAEAPKRREEAGKPEAPR